MTADTYPALFLSPTNGRFEPKRIPLFPNERVVVGRFCGNAKTVPTERNGRFDSKTLSRQHAEVWEEGGKIYVKDIGSSNGTYLNGTRLSPEALQSDPFQLSTGDTLVFGINCEMVGEDDVTVTHQDIETKVTCVFNEEDANAAQSVDI